MKKILPALLVAVLVLAAYAPALRDGFVWDDTALVLRDPLIRSWRLIPEGFQHFLFTDATASDFYRPIQRLTYTLDYGMFAFRPAGYHLTSILCHLAAALALLLLARELLALFGVEEEKRHRVALFAALAWAIHPVHTAAVVYVSGRADPLAAAFGFVGLYFAILSLAANRAKQWRFLLAGGACFLLSGLSKESGLVFLALWGAILLLKKKWKELRPALVLTGVVMAVYLGLRLPAEHFPAPTLRAPAPLLVRPIVAARAVAEYTGLILLPINLHMDREVETLPEGPEATRANTAAWRELQTLLGVLLVAGAIYWFWRSRKQDAAISTCLALALIAYLPISGIFALNATIAEHWIYLPTAFLFLAVGVALPRVVIPRIVLGSIFALWLIFLGARTWMRTFDWKDQRTFLERTIASGGDSARMFINLAGLDLNEGQLESAKKHLALALRKEPNQPLAILNLASVALRQNDFAAVHNLLERVKTVPPFQARAYELLGLLEHKEKGSVNIAQFRLATRTGPPNWSIEKRYIELLDQSGDTPAAMTELRSVLETQWYRAESWQLLSELQAKTGQMTEAAAARASAEAYDVHLSKRLAP